MPLYVEDKKINRLHWPLILSVAAVAGLGVWNLASAGRGEPGALWLAQLKALLLGATLAAGSLFIDYRLFRKAAWPLYLGALLMLVLVHFHGESSHGAQRWLALGPIHLQPSEFAKLAVILLLARHFADNPPQERTVRKGGVFASVSGSLERRWAAFVAKRRKRLAAAPRKMTAGRTRRQKGYRLPDLVVPLVYLLVPVVLVVKQPDLGTGLVTVAIGGSLVLFAGLTSGTLATLLTGGAGATLAVWRMARIVLKTPAAAAASSFSRALANAKAAPRLTPGQKLAFRLIKPYQAQRVVSFLHPQRYAQGAAYHVTQSLIAVGSGGLWGKGWGNGTQVQLSFLPEQVTDFAFPVWAEEHGFVGAAIVVVLYLVLVLIALDIASQARDRFGAFLAFGAAALFFWHAFINIAMVTGVLPVVGVPLLLMSYGGSSAVLTLLAIGALLNVSLRRVGQ